MMALIGTTLMLVLSLSLCIQLHGRVWFTLLFLSFMFVFSHISYHDTVHLYVSAMVSLGLNQHHQNANLSPPPSSLWMVVSSHFFTLKES